MNKLQEKAKEACEKWLEKDIGKRCEVFSDFCPVCEMWRRFDRLFCDVDKEYKWMEVI